VMRGVPHTLGLQASLERDTALVPSAPAEMTGWSGDGAPGTGSLRDFAIGAVTQHFTKSLQRLPGDFKLPKENQLDAMEAFQLSLGRSKDFVLAAIAFEDANVEEGKNVFINGGGQEGFGGTCNFCHTNAGALSVALGNQNRNFDTSVEEVLHPARAVENFPIDGGFGRAPVNPDGGIGNRTFNTPPVVEAADTAPFFHNNVVTTLDGVMSFYTGPEFNDQARIDSGAAFKFTDLQIAQLVDFMRGVNTLQNINAAQRELDELIAQNNNPQNEQNKRLQAAFDEIEDAIGVLNAGGIYPAVVTQHLTPAQNLISQALLNNDPSQRRALVQQAIAKLVQARDAVATGATNP
jgi:hypothetical protein